MNTRILPAIIVSFFLFQSVGAQDTAKSVVKNVHQGVKHANRNHINDSIKAARAKNQDSAKAHKIHTVKIPKYRRDGYIAIMGGYGIPAGAYLSNGYATSGPIFSISAGFPGIISHCGLAFKFDYGMNSLNQAQYINSLNSEIGLPNINYSFTGTVENFSYKTLLTGLYLTYPGKHFSIDARILGGVMMAVYPAFSVTVSDPANGNNGALNQSETKGNGFAFDVGIELRYHVIPRLSVILSADYLHSNPSFTDVVTGIASSSGGIILQDYGETTAGQIYSLFNFSLGVGYTIAAQKPTISKTN